MVVNSAYRVLIDTFLIDDFTLRSLIKVKDDFSANSDYIIKKHLSAFIVLEEGKKMKKLSFNYDLPLMQFSPFITEQICFNNYLAPSSEFESLKNQFIFSALHAMLSNPKALKGDKVVCSMISKLSVKLIDDIEEGQSDSNQKSILLDRDNYYVSRRINEPFKERFDLQEAGNVQRFEESIQDELRSFQKELIDFSNRSTLFLIWISGCAPDLEERISKVLDVTELCKNTFCYLFLSLF